MKEYYLSLMVIGLFFNLTVDAQDYCRIENGHECVDLGLPSGTLWATCNMGAESPEEYGDYYAWGELETKSSYDWDSYKWADGSEYSINKYNKKDGNFRLDMEDDVANQEWGDGWQIPTYDMWEELMENCEFEGKRVNGIPGFKVTGPNEEYIFLPAAGYMDGDEYENVEDDGYFWSTAAYPSSSDFARDFHIYYYSGLICNDLSALSRRYGLSIRPVYCE